MSAQSNLEPSNLARLNAALEGLTVDQQHTASDLLLGYVSGLVPVDEWVTALVFAVKHVTTEAAS